MQEVYLSTPLQFSQAGFPDDSIGETTDEGLDRETSMRRGRDHREISQPLQRHGKGSRDGGGGECQYIHLRPDTLQLLLLTDTKPVLLIDDDQSQIFEFDTLLDQLVSADDDINLTPCQPLH